MNKKMKGVVFLMLPIIQGVEDFKNVSRFFCTRCGREGIPIPRKNNRAREAGHLKKLWCIYCKDEVNHVEVKNFTHYDLKDFEIEFNYGNFDKDGNRKMPYGKFKQSLHNSGVI